MLIKFREIEFPESCFEHAPALKARICAFIFFSFFFLRRGGGRNIEAEKGRSFAFVGFASLNEPRSVCIQFLTRSERIGRVDPGIKFVSYREQRRIKFYSCSDSYFDAQSSSC